MKRAEFFKLVLLGAVLIFSAILIFIPHFDYRYPLHLDEWNRITEAGIIKNEGFSTIFDYPVGAGFTLFLYFIDLFLPLVLIYKFLPVFNLLLVSGVLFYFLNKRYNYWTGIFGILFFVSLRSNTNILGNLFFVPITFAAAFIYFCLFLLDETKKNPHLLYLVFLALLFIISIHPSSFLVLSFVVFLYYIFNYKFALRNYRHFLPFLILIIPTIIIGLNVAKNYGGLLSKITWGLSVIQINFNPLILYGVLSSIFALIGFVLVFKRKELLAFRIYVSISLISLIGFLFFNFTIFSSYQRYLYHFMIGAVPLSAFGFYEVLKFLYSFFRNYKNELRIVILGVLVVLSFSSIFFFFFSAYPGSENFDLGIDYVIDDSDYDAMMFLRDYGIGYVNQSYYFHAAEVVSPRFPGTAMYAITNKGSISNLDVNSFIPNEIADNFFLGNCNIKQGTFENYQQLRYVYSYEEINCSFLNEIFRNDKVFLYDLN